ncbi:MAG: formimidoylglutamase [Flavobacteriaceae bacterium]
MIIDFLSPVSEEVIAHAKLQDKQSLGVAVTYYREGEEFPEIEKGTVVIVGVKENRNDVNYLGGALSFSTVRKSFAELFPGNWSTKIVDIGDILPGEAVSDTYFALKKVVELVVKMGAMPVILGGSHDLTYAMYRAYDNLDQMVSLVCVDAKFDLKDPTEGIKNTNYMNSVVVEEPNNLINFSNIGFQTYYNSQEEIDLLEKLYFEAYRLGEVSNDISIIEPITRDADVVSFDMTAIQASEISIESSYRSPNGFNGKEACAIARYAGVSNSVSSFGLFELNNKMSASGIMLAAQMLWYFIEGANCKIVEPPLTAESSYKKYIVPSQDYDFVFYESLLSHRWWVKLPDNENENNNIKKHSLLSCTQEDYLIACDQQIPKRIYKAFRKNLI